MLWALALLGLVPAAFTFVGEDDETDDETSTPDGDESSLVDDLRSTDLLDFAYPDVPVNEGEVDDGADDAALDPNDPDAPDEAGPEGSPDDEPVDPNDPDAPDEPGPTGSDDDVVLDPNAGEDDVVGDNSGGTQTYTLDDGGETFILPDDPQSGGVAATLVEGPDGLTFDTEGTLHIVEGGAGADVIAAGDDASVIRGGGGDDAIYGGDGSAILDGGDGNDTLIAGEYSGSSYVLTGGAGEDTFGLHFDSASGAPAVIISDYDGAEDVIMLEIDSVTAARGPIEVDIAPSDDGVSSVITVNGVEVAVVNSAPNLMASDVVVNVA